MNLNSTKTTPDAERKACIDCNSLKGALSWWCRNGDAIAWRGTSIPGVHSCLFWTPAPIKSELPWHKRWFGSYI